VKNISKIKAILLSCASLISLNLQASVKETEREVDLEHPYGLVNHYHESDSLSRRVNYRVPIEEIIGACSHRYKATFKNFDQFNRNLVRSFTNEYFSFLDKSDTNIQTTHFDSLVPLIKKFKSYVELLPNLSSAFSDAREDILGDIEFTLRTRRLTGKPLVTIPFYLDAHARLIASLSTPGEGEKSIFWHAVNPEYLLGLYKNEAWRTLLKPFFEIRDFDNKGQEVEVRIQSRYISRQVIDYIDEVMKDQIYPNIHYPMYGEEKLGIPFLTYLALKRIYPFAYSHSPKGGAHGLKKISPAGMSAHDFVHSELDARTSYLKKNIVEFVDRIYIDSLVSGSPVSAQELASLYAPMAIQRLLRIEGTLEWFFEKLMSEVLPQRGLSEFKRIMGGFFWVMRESIGFNSELYQKHGLTDVLDSFIETALAKLNDPEHSWEISSNPLNTNPFDGTSAYSDMEIIEGIKKEHHLDKRYGEIKSAKVSYSPSVEFAPLAPQYRFVDVVFEFMNGHEMTFSFPTMYHRLTNIEDARNLLLWAGTSIPKIKGIEGLSNEEANLRVAEYVDRIRHSLVDHIKYFKSVFDFFLLEERGGSPSLDQEYVRWTLNQEKKLRKSLKEKSKEENSQVFQEKQEIEKISKETNALITYFQ